MPAKKKAAKKKAAKKKKYEPRGSWGGRERSRPPLFLSRARFSTVEDVLLDGPRDPVLVVGRQGA